MASTARMMYALRGICAMTVEADTTTDEGTEKRQSVSISQNPAHSPHLPHMKRPPLPVSPGRGKDTVKKAPVTPDEVRALLFSVLDQHTSEMMVRSLRKKIAKGNVSVLEFLFDRIIGRPAVNVHHEADGALAQFIGAWQSLVIDANLEQAPPLTLTDAEYHEIGADVPDDDDDASDDDE